MKKMLHFIAGSIIFLLSGLSDPLAGQEIIFSEDFSGFSAGSHLTPSTSDASASLDTKTTLPGWSGSLIYPAGGEIKLGTSSSTGWIETPLIDISGTDGNIVIKFDIARWTNDATTVQVYFNGTERGAVITPTDNFQTILINCTGESSPGKVKIAGLTKRFYLDNFFILKGSIPTGISEILNSSENIKIYPVPAESELKISSMEKYDRIEILDMTGTVQGMLDDPPADYLSMGIAHLKEGIYILKFSKGNYITYKRFIKTGK